MNMTFDYHLLLLWGILPGIFLAVVTFLIYNRRLASETLKRTETARLLNDAQERLEQNNKQLADYVDIVDKYVITSSTDIGGTIISASAAFCELSGYSEQELIDNNHSIVHHSDMPESVYQELWSTITRGIAWQGELENRKKDGSPYWVHACISPVLDAQGSIAGYTAIHEDLSSKKQAEELSITDELSSLFNRRHFNNLFPQELARAEREQKHIALIIIDIDYFKPYNDNYGHQQGDSALKTVAKVLKSSLRRAGDFAFRIGGEEFAVIVTVEHSEDVYKLAEKLRKSVEDLKLEHAYNQGFPYMTVSIGIKTHQGSGGQAPKMELMYRLADDALYQAKGNGRNQVAGADIRQLKIPGKTGSIGR
jgi:diguanylate cyclase (GGDEF)-like protein/PAS domain S-box-containing protein